jgi:hypothetical protein
MQAETVSRGRKTPQDDPWRIPEWDDVWWWVTDRLDRIDPDLRGVA